MSFVQRDCVRHKAADVRCLVVPAGPGNSVDHSLQERYGVAGEPQALQIRVALPHLLKGHCGGNHSTHLPYDLSKMLPGLAFELQTSRLLAGTATRRSWDGGIDIRGRINTVPFVASCKQYTRQCPADAVRALIGVLIQEPAGTIGILATNKPVSIRTAQTLIGSRLPMMHIVVDDGSITSILANQQVAIVHGLVVVGARIFRDGHLIWPPKSSSADSVDVNNRK